MSSGGRIDHPRRPTASGARATGVGGARPPAAPEAGSTHSHGSASGLRRRVGWGLAAQALSSLTNFALAILVAQRVDRASFGVFGLAFATYVLVLEGSRAVTGWPLLIRFSDVGRERWRSAVAESAGAALAGGVSAGIACAIAGALLGGTLGVGLLVLGSTLPGLLLQDAWRHSFMSAGEPRRTFANDLTWTVALVAGTAAVIALGRDSLAWLMLVWGGSACVAAVFGLLQTRIAPNPMLARRWWEAHRDIASRYLGEAVLTTGVLQLLIYLIGALGGLMVVGAYRGGETMLGPVNILLFALAVVAVPEGVRLLARAERPERALLRSAAMVSTSLVLVTASWGGIVLAVPDSLGSQLLGATWKDAHAILVPLTVAFAGNAASSGAFFGLRSLAAANRSFFARGVTAVLILALGTSGVALADAAGAAAGVAIAWWLGAAVAWRQLVHAIAERRST